MEKFKCDIISDQPFHEADTVFTNVLKDIKARGKGDTMHYPEIEPEDLEKLSIGFNIHIPTCLQELV